MKPQIEITDRLSHFLNEGIIYQSNYHLSEKIAFYFFPLTHDELTSYVANNEYTIAKFTIKPKNNG